VERIPDEVIAEASHLFWDVDASRLDPTKHEDFILGRVLAKGSWAALRAIRLVVGEHELREFVRRAPHRLDRRSLRFLEVVLRMDQEKCTTTPFRRSNEQLFSP
jgi:hypothetical protein